MTALQCGLMQQLKDSTRELHEVAEGHPFQQALAGGRLPREQFVSFLGQMLPVHEAVERHLRSQMAAGAAATGVIRDHHFRADLLRQDLRFLGADPAGIEPTPTPATAELVRQMDAEVARSPVAVLGFHYVLEGSTHGSKFTARSARQAYALASEQGTAYLDPHGEQQRERWLAFKQDMDALDLGPDETAAAVAAARQMFAGIVAISESLRAQS